LRDVLQSQHGATGRIAERDTDALRAQYGDTESVTDVLHAFQERLTIQSEGLQKIMAFAENIDKRVKALEQSAGTHEETGAATGPS
jgi:hypothetical protein